MDVTSLLQSFALKWLPLHKLLKKKSNSPAICTLVREVVNITGFTRKSSVALKRWAVFWNQPNECFYKCFSPNTHISGDYIWGTWSCTLLWIRFISLFLTVCHLFFLTSTFGMIPRSLLKSGSTSRLVLRSTSFGSWNFKPRYCRFILYG